MSANLLIYLSFGLAVIAFVVSLSLLITSKPSRAIKKYFRKENQPENLEEVIEQIIDKLTALDDHAQATSHSLQSLSDQLNTATQHVGIIRYNSNGDDGGNLSFSAAFLDAHQSGIVLTSLHGRQNNRIYAKVITQGASESTLSDEEREALIQALTGEQQIQTAKPKSNRK